jgi:hypothetical protein
MTSKTLLWRATRLLVVAATAAGWVPSDGVDAGRSLRQSSPDAVWIEATAERHASGQVTYHYRAVTALSRPIIEIQLGLVPSMDEPELVEAPVGWDPETRECPPSIRVPAGWTGCVGRQEESSRVFIIIAAGSGAEPLPPNAEMRFSVTVGRPDPTYETTRFSAQSPVLPHVEGRVRRVGGARINLEDAASLIHHSAPSSFAFNVTALDP